VRAVVVEAVRVELDGRRGVDVVDLGERVCELAAESVVGGVRRVRWMARQAGEEHRWDVTRYAGRGSAATIMGVGTWVLRTSSSTRISRSTV
jgi:isocitrate dehydrogenase